MGAIRPTLNMDKRLGLLLISGLNKSVSMPCPTTIIFLDLILKPSGVDVKIPLENFSASWCFQVIVLWAYQRKTFLPKRYQSHEPSTIHIAFINTNTASYSRRRVKSEW